MDEIKQYIIEKLGITEKIYDFVNSRSESLGELCKKSNRIREYNQLKVLNAFHKNRLSQIDFYWTTGYGYGDYGRDKVEDIYKTVFNTEAALVRPSIASGTHAIYLCLSALLKYGDEFIYISGTPYDTLLQIIGVEGEQVGTLMQNGVKYSEVSLKENNTFDDENIFKKISDNTKMICIQRSTGYSDRPAITIKEIDRIIKIIKLKYPEMIIFVDNCYGEFTDIYEPSDCGADITAGSLIKNPGGGIALSGGYIVGKEEYINLIANRLTAPGLGKEIGLTFGMTRNILQGLYFAPHVVAEALKGAILIAKVYEDLGYEVVPKSNDDRYDIIQAIKFNDKNKMTEFCRAIQSSSAVDAHVVPESWDMPGYEDFVIMAAGGFIDGSSIEMSADGPMREPYFAYYQGGVIYEHIVFALMKTLKVFSEKGYINI